MAKSTKTDVDLKALLVEAMSEGFDSYMGKSSHPDIPIYLGAMHECHVCHGVVFEDETCMWFHGDRTDRFAHDVMTWPCFALGMDSFRWGKAWRALGVKVPSPTSGWTQGLGLEEDTSSDWGVLCNAGPRWHWSKIVFLSAIFVRNCWKSAWKWKIRACPTTCHLWDSPTV